VDAAPALATSRAARRAKYQAHPRYRSYVLAVLMVGVFSSSFPSTLLSASLPSIAADLHTSTAVITWVQTAPTIVFAIAMPFFGKLGDLHGHRRPFIWGFGALAVTALLTAVAWNAGALIAFRCVGMLCGAATSTAAFSLIVAVFEREDRTKAIGAYTSVLAISPVVAVVVGGPLIDAVGWRLLFVLQFLPAALATIAARPILPETPRHRATRFDITGAVTLGGGITAILFAVNRGSPWGWDHPVVLLGFVLGPLLLVGFVLVEHARDEPLLPLGLFRDRNFSAALVTNAVVQLSYIGGFATAPFLVHRLFGYGTYKTSLVIAVRPVLFSVGAWLAGRGMALAEHRSSQITGSVLLTAGSACTGWGAHAVSLPLVVVGLGLVGLGVGFGRPGNVTTVTNAVDPEDVGIAIGVLNMTAQVGTAVGITLLLAMVGDSVAPSVFVRASLAAAAIGAVSIVTALFLRPGVAHRDVNARQVGSYTAPSS
jgi:MFS family permease